MVCNFAGNIGVKRVILVLIIENRIYIMHPVFHMVSPWGGSRGGSGGSVEPPKLKRKYFFHTLKKELVE